jgi:multisubunit Na+/H+ antiporter MnhB subunit
VFVVALIWALAVWRIAVAATEYAFRNLVFFKGYEFTIAVEIGLLVLAVAGAALWTFTSSDEKKRVVHMHSTQLISGGLFVVMGLLMLEAQLSYFNNIIPPELAEWLAQQEDKLISIFSQ